MCTLGLESIPAGPRETLEEQLVGQLRLRNGSFPTKCKGFVVVQCFEAAGDFGIDAAHEERGDAVHPGEISPGPGEGFEP